MRGDIDIVVTYLDDADPTWREAKARWTGGSCDERNGEARYRSLDLFRFWLRSIERFAPWVRMIHVVTYGHLPSWLDVDHPKINTVCHEDFIPSDYLPTFSSRAIELNLDRITGLSERFVNFNDDMFLTAPTREQDFFVGDRPVLWSRHQPVIASEEYSAVLFWNLLALNRVTRPHGSVLSAMRRARRSGLKSLAAYCLIEPLERRLGTHIGFAQDHLAQPLKKSVMADLRRQLAAEFSLASRNRVRHGESINVWMVLDYFRATGQFVPRGDDFGRMVPLHEDTDYEMVLAEKRRIVCLNDGPRCLDFAHERLRVSRALARMFPEPSAFELSL